MNKNYMIYPMKYMRITCRYDEYSHKNHNVNVSDGLVDYPIDDAGKDTGRDPIYCPCDEMVVTAIRGVGNPSITNTIWLVSTSAVVTPTFTDIAYMTLTHSNDEDFKNIKVGDKFKRFDIICYEGTNGASSNHIHITAGKGSSITWKQNSNGSWVMVGDAKKPEDVFYIDPSFTEIINSGNLAWVDLPKTATIGTPVARDTSKNQVEVLVDNLNARSNYSTSSTSFGYIKRGIYNILDTKENEGYIWVKVEDYWIATNEGWTKIYEAEPNQCCVELKKLKEDYPKLIFECLETGKYLIYLEKGKKLYIK